MRRDFSRATHMTARPSALHMPWIHRPFRSPLGAPPRAPWKRQTWKPRTAGCRHASRVRFERAEQRGAEAGSPRRLPLRRVFSRDMGLILDILMIGRPGSIAGEYSYFVLSHQASSAKSNRHDDI
jgi:hypothetical protein